MIACVKDSSEIEVFYRFRVGLLIRKWCGAQPNLTHSVWDTTGCDPAVAQICCSVSPERRHRGPQEHSKPYERPQQTRSCLGSISWFTPHCQCLPLKIALAQLQCWVQPYQTSCALVSLSLSLFSLFPSLFSFYLDPFLPAFFLTPFDTSAKIHKRILSEITGITGKEAVGDRKVCCKQLLQQA